jgi:phytoene synthase
MINKQIYSLFQNGSRTYFYSSLFFPPKIKKEVFSLYGFVRKTDNFVDSIPQDINGFYQFKDKYYKAENGIDTNDIIIDSFIQLSRNKNFDPKWTESFLKSMEMDIKKNSYETLDDTLEYIYGSAEVIGFFMSRLMNLSKEANSYAKYLGRAMQYINFIRDIDEDNKLGRIYFPNKDLEEYGLKSLNYEETSKHKEEFTLFIHKQIDRYCKWQHYAEEGYKYIPKRYLIPVKTASEMYKWTAEQIYKNPFVVYNMKIKPMVKQIFTKTMLNMIDPSKPYHNMCFCKDKQVIPQIS